MKTIAIGDVHGCISLLQQKVQPLIGSQSEVVFLGDLIDRSPEPNGDLRVLQLVKFMEENPSAFGLHNVVVLTGNHEQMLLHACLEGFDNPMAQCWLENGGNPELLDDIEPFIEWLMDRPICHIKDNYLFVHAGVRPNIPLHKQNPQDLIWIRDQFLDSDDHGLPYVVVHGHTPTYEPEVLTHRINVDTGAYATGNLTALQLP